MNSYEPFKKDVLYYQQENRVRGVLLWKVWEYVDAARALIAKSGPISQADMQLC
nr:hypothetical protein [Methylomarinum sp. Ch1-1]MDP4520708.1 hypothetical protein [Methylomarinum sp. Ch1-1]